jgi:septum formation protein
VLVLASGSPRRSALLTEAGIAHRILPVSVDETVPPAMPPADVAVALAVKKARAARPAAGGDPILAADTLIAWDGRILGKPDSPSQAVSILTDLSGREHEVITGVCLLLPESGREVTRAVSSRVLFRSLAADEIRDYVSTGEPLDKAGAYGIQAGGGKFVAKLTGSRSNVIGLPMETVVELLEGIPG